MHTRTTVDMQSSDITEGNASSNRVTNTIIVTSPGASPTDAESVQTLRQWLSQTVLEEFAVTDDCPLQMILLPAFRRILLISPSRAISQRVMQESTLPIVADFRFSYSLADTAGEAERQYLELPKGQRLFLVSPPTSPPPGFDYSRCEERPSTETISKAHLDTRPHLYSVLGADEGKGEQAITLLDSRQHKIVLNTCATLQGEREVEGPAETVVPTAMPPRSIFDNDEDLLSDVDE